MIGLCGLAERRAIQFDLDDGWQVRLSQTGPGVRVDSETFRVLSYRWRRSAKSYCFAAPRPEMLSGTRERRLTIVV